MWRVFVTLFFFFCVVLGESRHKAVRVSTFQAIKHHGELCCKEAPMER